MYGKAKAVVATLVLLSFSAHTVCAESGGTRKADISARVAPDVDGIVNALLYTRDPYTKLSPSHWGHPGYGNLAFMYDKAVDALILKAAGRQQEAEDVLDYFAARYAIPTDEAVRGADTNNIYGIIKIVGSGDTPLKSLINAVQTDSRLRQGRGMLEFATTPGPLAFLIFAMLHINAEKYKDTAVGLGRVLAWMQDPDGGIRDGDRSPDKVHTEPHMDTFAAFLMLYQVTGDAAWQGRADAAYAWFEKNVYHPERGVIDQGVWAGEANDIFAEDVYAWTMAGPAGDRMDLDVLKALTRTMLGQSLVKINLALPDATTKNVILVDFGHADDPRIKAARGGYHPLGSVEWTGGAVLALQKNAVRLWNAGDADTAKHYKAMAEFLLAQTMKCFYYLEELGGKATFYATGQGYEVAPFGSVREGLSRGWITPTFFMQDQETGKLIRGGSSVGNWPLLPYFGLNPFILGDGYKKIYDAIPLTGQDRAAAYAYLNKSENHRYFAEVVRKGAPHPATQIVEPVTYVTEMWRAILNAEKGVPCAKDKNCYEEAIVWAGKVVGDPLWVSLAKRDNALKEAAFHGIIQYPWGAAYKENTHPVHQAIARYPILNEVGTAMWGLAVANFERGDIKQTKYWMGRIIDDVPLHQVAVTEEEAGAPGEKTIIGYWNALVSWEHNPGNSLRDGKMAKLYREVLAEKGMKNAAPAVVSLSPGPDAGLAGS